MPPPSPPIPCQKKSTRACMLACGEQPTPPKITRKKNDAVAERNRPVNKSRPPHLCGASSSVVACMTPSRISTLPPPGWPNLPFLCTCHQDKKNTCRVDEKRKKTYQSRRKRFWYSYKYPNVPICMSRVVQNLTQNQSARDLVHTQPSGTCLAGVMFLV